MPFLLLIFVAAASQADPDLDSHGQNAARFSQLFLDGKDAEIDAMMTGQMRSAFSAAQRTQIRSDLTRKYGKSRVGDAWQEDKLQGYLRYRVPLFFAEETLDFRVVIDRAGKVAGFFIVPHLEPPAVEKPEGAPDKEIEVTVGAAETGLAGLLTLPSGEGPFPAVVLVHGSGPHDKDETIGPNKPFRELAWGLAERGVAVLRYDKRSYARPQDLEALGDDLTVEEEVVEDAHAAVRLLRRRREIDRQRIFVAGHSLGGALAPWIAATLDPRPAGLIVLAGAVLPLPEKMLDQTRYVAALDGVVSEEEQIQLDKVAREVEKLRAALEAAIAMPSGSVLGAPVGYYASLESHDPPVEAAALGLPVLVLQGKRDYQVTMEDFALWQTALADRPGACLVAYDGLDHLFRHGTGPSAPQDYERLAPVAPRVIDDLAAWIESQRCP